MDKTRTVIVTRQVYEPRVGRYVRKAKKYMAHDEYNETRAGDIVEFKLVPKMSKNKSFQITRIVLPFRRGADPLLPLEAQQPTVVPEKALTPRKFLPNDKYRDDVDGLFNPYVSNQPKPASNAAAAASEAKPSAK